ncbi:MAG: molybdopterin-dependent oxidoreductase [Dehalococcoidia bacterium]|nr:molybdopterin-dependent oxidoreductase [Dehalococcoidia bacterium]
MELIKTDCILCVWGCGINAYVEDGRLVKVEGMTEHPLNQGVLCPRGRQLVDYVYSPDRLRYPMKRVNGSWERISWDEALDTIAGKLQQIKDKYGAHALAIFCGSIGVENNELAAFARRFRGAYGTPNFLSVESNCFRSRILAHQLTFGAFLLEEPEKAKCIILWGHDPDNSKLPLANKLYQALDKGMELIVINPKRTSLAKRGIHVQLRPGTDCALALGMLNVIISEDLYDKEFVDKYTVGFDKLVEHVKQYSPQKVEKITWVAADDIKRIARIFATTKPASIIQGICSLDQQINGLQTSRVLALLQVVTGNIDIPGSWVNVPFPRLGSLHIKVEEKPIGAAEHPLFYSLWGRQSPYGQTMYFADTVLTEKPYPIKALIVTGGNPVLTLPDSNKISQALDKLELLVVIDLFMTETAEMADIVLPACSFIERSGLGYVYAVTSGMPYIILRKRLIEPLWECWPDWKFWCELGRKMGYEDLFPWQTDDEVVEHWLKPTGLTIKQLTEQSPEGVFFADKKYDMCQKGEFRTPSGKIEIYSETLAEHGYDPLPVHVEPSQSPVSHPELAQKYPLILTTGARILEYTHTQFRNVPQLQQSAPEPIAEIHPDTAAKYGVADGDTIAVETRKGQIEIKVRTTEDLAPGVVSIPHGWAQANANILTELEPRDPVTGYTQLKALLCRIRSLKDKEVKAP